MRSTQQLVLHVAIEKFGLCSDEVRCSSYDFCNNRYVTCSGRLLSLHHMQKLKSTALQGQCQNLKSGSTLIAQKNFVINVLLNIFSMGTSFRLHHATVIRGSK